MLHVNRNGPVGRCPAEVMAMATGWRLGGVGVLPQAPQTAPAGALKAPSDKWQTNCGGLADRTLHASWEQEAHALTGHRSF